MTNQFRHKQTWGSSKAAAYQQGGLVSGETHAVGVQLVESGLICPGGAGAHTLFCSLLHRPHQPPDGCFHLSMVSQHFGSHAVVLQIQVCVQIESNNGSAN